LEQGGGIGKPGRKRLHAIDQVAGADVAAQEAALAQARF